MPTPKPPKVLKPRDERERRARENAMRLVDSLFEGISNYAYNTRSHMPNRVDYTNFLDSLRRVGKFCHARPDWTLSIVERAIVEYGKPLPPDDREEQDDMALHEPHDQALIVALVKAAIGEGQVYFQSYEQEDRGFAGSVQSIHVTIGGDVEGKLRLTGQAAQNVIRAFQMSHTSEALKRANEKADRLSKKLSQLHALSDPES